MKRVIKFRGRRPDGSWNYGRSIIFKRSGAVLIQGAKVDPDTVGQFTGIYDRKGSEIYEGDIVRTSVSKNGIALVEWHCEHAAFVVHMKGSDQWYHLYKGYEKIGNIHDNPSLLEGGLKCFTL